jgi:mannosylglycoprotein endo-beta-mannosidase
MDARRGLSMIVCSFNVRGLGSRVKRSKLREVVRVEKVDFLAIQETKLEAIPGSLIANIWGNDEFDWAFLSATGNSGGILSI